MTTIGSIQPVPTRPALVGPIDAKDHLAASAAKISGGSPTLQARIMSQAQRPGRQTTPELRDALTHALSVDPNASIAVDRRSNSATFLNGTFRVPVREHASKAPKDHVAKTFLGIHGTLFGVESPAEELKLIHNEKDNLGFNHFKYQQTYKGLPVFGQQVVVHERDNVVSSVGGRLTPNIAIPVEPILDAQAAISTLIAAKPSLTSVAPPVVKNKELGVYTTQAGKPVLAYQFDLAAKGTPNHPDGDRFRYYVDAKDGKVLDQWSLNEPLMNRETYDARNGQSRPGKLVRKEGDTPGPDEVANKAHDNGRAVYEYFQDNHGRDSLDNRGMKLVSTVHYGNKYNNAYWDGKQMTYGDGDGETFTPLGSAVDVVGHEMTHGITEKTAGLRYVRQSGALNESWSDVMGNLIERWDYSRSNPGKPDKDPDYMVGEDIFTPKIPGDALRSMANPGTAYPKDPQPGHMKDYKNIDYDNGGVHINSGIPNRAAYMVAKSIGDDKLGKIWYRAQTNYLTAGSQFSDAANLTVQAAVDLYGPSSAEAKAVRDAWSNVGLAPASGAPKLK